MKYAFQIDPIEKLDLTTDSTWQLMLESSKYGKVYFYTPKNLFWFNGELLAIIQEIEFKGDEYILKDCERKPLNEMDVIFFRQNPPYDMNYLSTSYLLEKISEQVLIVNNPRAIRDFPEKLSILDYNDLIPPTVISSNLNEIEFFAKQYDKIILKPLYSYAGTDVFCLKYSDTNFSGIFENLIKIHKAPIIAQKFINDITKGDKRIILIDGEILGAYNRIPKKESIKANSAQGGSVHPCELTSRDIEICNILKPKLLANNIFFAGIDVIAGNLTEINITSPTGLTNIQKFYNKNVTQQIFDLLHKKIIKK